MDGALKKYPKRPGAQRFQAYYVAVVIHATKIVQEPFVRGWGDDEERGVREVTYLQVQEVGKNRRWVNARDVKVNETPAQRIKRETKELFHEE